jgi:hypothetical protein
VPVAQLKYEPEPQATHHGPHFTRQSGTGPSPALVLQRELEQHHQIAGDLDKWSPRQAMAFIVGASAAMWMAILAASAEAMKALA